MVKYRIKRKDNKFYPEKKKFLFWNRISCYESFYGVITAEPVHSSPFRRCFEMLQASPSFIMLEKKYFYFNSFEDAMSFINDYEKKPKRFNYKKHIILKTYNGDFIDLSCNVYIGKYWGDVYYGISAINLDSIKTKIDKFEEEWEEKVKTKIYNV